MKNLKKIRKEKKLTQADVAKILDITVSAYGNYELGQRSPTPEVLIKLARYFGVSVDYLLDYQPTSEDIKQGFQPFTDLTAEQQELLMYFNEIGDRLGSEAQKALITYAKFVAEGSK